MLVYFFAHFFCLSAGQNAPLAGQNAPLEAPPVVYFVLQTNIKIAQKEINKLASRLQCKLLMKRLEFKWLIEVDKAVYN
jgi:hypothetical protein